MLRSKRRKQLLGMRANERDWASIFLWEIATAFLVLERF